MTDELLPHEEEADRMPPTPPQTGVDEVDRSLASLDELRDLPLGEHHDRLRAVQDALGGVLESSRNAVPGSVPEGLRPKQEGQHG